MHLSHQRSIRAADTTSQLSDDIEVEGICPSCRLAINKDTGRLKWCMGGSDMCRTRIRLLMLIPAVILPIAIIIIALSKSQVIGKLTSRSNNSGGGPLKVQPSNASLDEPQPSSLLKQHLIHDIEEAAAELAYHGSSALHPHAVTSFLPARASLERHKRHANEGTPEESQEPQSMSGAEFSASPSERPYKQKQQQQQQREQQKNIIIASSRPSSAPGTLKSSLPTTAIAARELQTRTKRQEAGDESSASESVAGPRSRACEDDEGADDEDEDEANATSEDCAEDEADDAESSSNSSASEDSSDGQEEENDAKIWPERSAKLHDEPMDFRAFWKSAWNEEYIRGVQAKMMLKYMDRSVDPCVDFYQYACGNWEKYNPIPEDKAGFDTFETLRESLDLVLKQLLEEPDNYDAGNEATLHTSAVAKAKYFYRSCMNYEVLERRMERPLLLLLDELGGWPMLRPEWEPDKFDWLLLVARLRLYNNDVLISEWIGPDIKNSDQYIIQLDQASLGMPSKDYYLQPSNARYLQAYKTYLVTVVTLLGASPRTAPTHAEELVQFEIQLANITISPDERRNISDLYRRMSLDELRRTVPQIDWRRYLSIVLARPVGNSEPVVVFATNYLKDLVKLLSRTRSRVVANYLFWRFVRHRVNNLDDRFLEAKQTFYYTLFGREKSPPRWKNCVGQVNSNMGNALGSLFVRKYFDEMSKNDTLSMTHEIQRSFRELLRRSTWLDDATRRDALDKLRAMQLRIGYPDFILESEELDRRYRDVLIEPDKYFENTLNVLRHLTRIEQDKLGAPVNKSVWSAAPAIVNAFYSRNKNQIMFPAGILQPPFYHRYFPRSLNYGGIGVVIGHEITHGFDDKGRLFDKDGNLLRWWSESSVTEFDRRAYCLVDQYSKYVVEEVDMALDGVNTQGENIADNGGIKQAFKAYDKWLTENPGESSKERLPGLEWLTGRQLFFLNFAQVWCGTVRPEAMRNKLKMAVHAPGRYRVIGTLSNSREFAQVYSCKSGMPMNPVDKCLVW